MSRILPLSVLSLKVNDIQVQTLIHCAAYVLVCLRAALCLVGR
jgi:hypothetical protein